MALFYLQFSGVVPGSGLCGGSPESIREPRITKWHFMSSLWICYGIYAGFYGFSERGMVLFIFGMHDCWHSDRIIDRSGAGTDFSSASSIEVPFTPI